MIRDRVDILELKEAYEGETEETNMVRGYLTYKLKYGVF